MADTQLRPLGIGEILDVAIKTYSKNARTLITIGAVVGVPLELLSGVVQLSTVTSSDQVQGSISLNAGTGTAAADFSRARVAGILVTLLIGLIVTLLLSAATVKAVSDAHLGTVPDVRDSLRFAVRRMRSLAWLYFVYGFGLVLGAVALLLPAIWLYVCWAVAVPALLLEELRGTKALRRSWRLVRGRWWPTAGLLLASFLIVGVTTGGLTGLLAVLPRLIDSSSVLLAVLASTVSAAIVAAMIQPLAGTITTILYFDLRVRKEGFDLALLATRLGLPAPDAPHYSLPALPDEKLAPGGEQPPFWPPPPGWKPSQQRTEE